MGDWITNCDCCNQSIKKIKNEDYTYTSFNIDGTEHEKHFKIWPASVASFFHFDKLFVKLDPGKKVGELTIGELDSVIEFKLNLKFGQYYHGQSGLKEVWLTPKKFTYNDVDYFISGNVDGIDDGVMIEFKTTWVSSQTKMERVIERAQTQADIYSWIRDFKEAKIIVKNLAKPELDTTVTYTPNPSNVEEILRTYIDENKDSIKKY